MAVSKDEPLAGCLHEDAPWRPQGQGRGSVAPRARRRGQRRASAATLGATLDIQVFAESNALRESGFGSLIFPSVSGPSGTRTSSSAPCARRAARLAAGNVNRSRSGRHRRQTCARPVRGGCPFFASSAMSSRADRRKFSNGFLSYGRTMVGLLWYVPDAAVDLALPPAATRRYVQQGHTPQPLTRHLVDFKSIMAGGDIYDVPVPETSKRLSPKRAHRVHPDDLLACRQEPDTSRSMQLQRLRVMDRGCPPSQEPLFPFLKIASRLLVA